LRKVDHLGIFKVYQDYFNPNLFYLKIKILDINIYQLQYTSLQYTKLISNKYILFEDYHLNINIYQLQYTKTISSINILHYKRIINFNSYLNIKFISYSILSYSNPRLFQA